MQYFSKGGNLLLKDIPLGVVLILKDISEQLTIRIKFRKNLHMCRGVLQPSPSFASAKQGDHQDII